MSDPSTFVLNSITDMQLTADGQYLLIHGNQPTAALHRSVLNDLLVAKPAEVEVDVEGSLEDLPAAGSLQVEAMGVEGCGWRSFQRATVAVDAEHKAHLRLNSGPWTFALVFVDDAGRRRELARQRRDLGPGGLGRVRLRAGTAGMAGAAASAGQ